LPLHWTTNENVRWRVALPEPGNSTPVVWGGRVFVTQAVENRRMLLCFDRLNGASLWQAGVPYAQEEPTHETNPQCSASPVTDGERVIASFGSAGLYCYDFKGREIWHRDLGQQRHIWGNAASPMLHGDLCILNFGPGERTFLIAVNKKTGQTVWQHDEPGGASGEKKQGQEKTDWSGSLSTPIVIRAEGREELIMSYPKRVVALEPQTGKELWTCGGLNPLNQIGGGFGFPVRFKIETSEDGTFRQGVSMVHDQQADFPNPKLEPAAFDAAGRVARYIRVTATKLAPRNDDYIFALAELSAFDASGTNIARGAVVSALDSIEAPPRWQKRNLTDGWYPAEPGQDTAEVAALRRERTNLLASVTSEEERAQLQALERESATAKEALAKLPAQSVVYVGAVHHGSGNFIGTGATGGKPRPIFVLNRGDVQKPGKEAVPGALAAAGILGANRASAQGARFDLPAGHTEGDRRAALARWLTDVRHPLTWRSIVNRVWQYHFGRGLVETPNDFGHMGALPSHPELLDWLAVEFRDSGQSLKKLHRLMLTSATYRQSSDGNEQFEKIDGDDRFLWRMNRRKLEAEAVRDSVLFVSGQLDLRMGGPSFQDFVIEKPEHSPHYEYQLHDAEAPASHRRSIYRFLVRSQPEPFMAALDCADPSMQVARRTESASPLQALALLNNSLMLAMSKHFAATIQQGGGSLKEQVSRAWYAAVGRPPERKELTALVSYTQEHGLENACRVLFNLNEFSFVD
jgi:hypothetical protein